MDGGLPRWIDEGHQVEVNSSNPAPVNHHNGPGTDQSSYPVPSLDETVIRCMSSRSRQNLAQGSRLNFKAYAEMVSNSTMSRTDPTTELVLDARSRGRCVTHVRPLSRLQRNLMSPCDQLSRCGPRTSTSPVIGTYTWFSLFTIQPVHQVPQGCY